MLQLNAVEPGTLDLLKKLSKHPALVDFRLVGGTSLALQMGHGLSFKNEDNDANPVLLKEKKLTWPAVKKEIIQKTKAHFN